MNSTFFNGYKLSSWFIILVMSQKEAGQQGVRLLKHIGSSRSWCVNTFIALTSALPTYVFNASPYNGTYVEVPEWFEFPCWVNAAHSYDALTAST